MYPVKSDIKRQPANCFCTYIQILTTATKSGSHIGDNRFADQVQPEMLGIQTAPIPVPEWTPYEKRLADYSSHYEFCCVAKQIQSFRLTHPTPEEQFAYCYAALYLVPYVVHAVSHAVKQGYRTLYFISR